MRRWMWWVLGAVVVVAVFLGVGYYLFANRVQVVASSSYPGWKMTLGSSSGLGWLAGQMARVGYQVHANSPAGGEQMKVIHPKLIGVILTNKLRLDNPVQENGRPVFGAWMSEVKEDEAILFIWADGQALSGRDINQKITAYVVKSLESYEYSGSSVSFDLAVGELANWVNWWRPGWIKVEKI